LISDAGDHDRAVALISHLPVLVSAALLQAAERGASGADRAALVRALASTGFADTTRVGGGNPELGSLMARCNREAVLEALGHYRQAIESLEQLLLQQQWPELQAELSHCQQLRPEFL
jgi:arogenate dehydrogenase (NADP+)